MSTEFFYFAFVWPLVVAGGLALMAYLLTKWDSRSARHRNHKHPAE
jgi:hypothetical protein